MSTSDPVDVPPPSAAGNGRVRSTLRAIRNLILVLLGVAVLTLAVLAGGYLAIKWFFSVEANAVESAAEDFAAYAEELPGVASAEAHPGLSDVLVPVTDIYGTVTLAANCTPDSMVATAETLRSWIADADRPLRVHPDLVCGDARLTISPLTAVTADRFTLLTALLDDPTVGTAAVRSTQPGDNGHVDDNNVGLHIDVHIEADTPLSSVVSTWLPRSAEFVRDARLTFNAGVALDTEYWGTVYDGLRLVSVVADGTPAPDVLSAVLLLENLESADGFAVRTGDGTSDLRVLLSDASASADVLTQLAPVAAQFATVEVTTR
jgi:hypothetical protein